MSPNVNRFDVLYHAFEIFTSEWNGSGVADPFAFMS